MQYTLYVYDEECDVIDMQSVYHKLTAFQQFNHLVDILDDSFQVHLFKVYKNGNKVLQSRKHGTKPQIFEALED